MSARICQYGTPRLRSVVPRQRVRRRDQSSGRVAPETAALKQPLSELVLHLLCLAGCLVFQPHRQLDGRHLFVRKLTCPFTHDRGQRTARYEQIDKIAAEGIGGPPQGVQANTAWVG